MVCMMADCIMDDEYNFASIIAIVNAAPIAKSSNMFIPFTFFTAFKFANFTYKFWNFFLYSF
jgi:hypothetical protein